MAEPSRSKKAWLGSEAVEVDRDRGVVQARAFEAPSHLARPRFGRDAARLLQRHSAVLGETQLLLLDHLPRMQRKELVGGLCRLQNADGALALADQGGERVLVGRQVLRRLRL